MFRLPANIWWLTLAGALTVSSASMMVLISGLLGAELAPTPALATLPLSCMILGTVSATIPTALMMEKFGRKRVYLSGSVIAFVGSIMGFSATWLGSFWLLLLASAALGITLAVNQQYRFGALESLKESSNSGYALSLLMMGGIVAAWLGPEAGTFGRLLLPEFGIYSGSFVILAGLQILGFAFLLNFKNPEISSANKSQETGRPLKNIVSSKIFVVAAGSAAVGYGVMAFLMTATPLSMNTIYGFSVEETKTVIQSHILAMFLPSLFTGWLMANLGINKLLLLGTLAFVAAIVVASFGIQYLHFWWALVLLGIGWNFLFLGGTSLLPNSYEPEERFKTQAANEFLVFGIQAIASFSAGIVIYALGWFAMVWLCIPILLFMFYLLYLHSFSEAKKSHP